MQIQRPANKAWERLISKVQDNEVEFVLYSLFWNHTFKSSTVIYLTLLLSVVKTGEQSNHVCFSVHLTFSLVNYFHQEHGNRRLYGVREIHIPVSTKYNLWLLPDKNDNFLVVWFSYWKHLTHCRTICSKNQVFPSQYVTMFILGDET